MPNFYFGKFEEVILIPLTVEIYFAIQHSQFSLEISAFLCCLCNYICKCLGYLVFSEKTGGPVSHLLSVHNSAGRERTHTLFEKSRARSSRCCGWPSSLMRAGIYYGTAVIVSRCCGIPARNKNLRNKINLWIGSMTTKFINVSLESNCTRRFSLFSKSLPYPKIFICEKSR